MFDHLTSIYGTINCHRIWKILPKYRFLSNFRKFPEMLGKCSQVFKKCKNAIFRSKALQRTNSDAFLMNFHENEIFWNLAYFLVFMLFSLIFQCYIHRFGCKKAQKSEKFIGFGIPTCSLCSKDPKNKRTKYYECLMHKKCCLKRI